MYVQQQRPSDACRQSHGVFLFVCQSAFLPMALWMPAGPASYSSLGCFALCVGLQLCYSVLLVLDALWV
jgi:hypothetical protein